MDINIFHELSGRSKTAQSAYLFSWPQMNNNMQQSKYTHFVNYDARWLDREKHGGRREVQTKQIASIGIKCFTACRISVISCMSRGVLQTFGNIYQGSSGRILHWSLLVGIYQSIYFLVMKSLLFAPLQCFSITKLAKNSTESHESTDTCPEKAVEFISLSLHIT